MWLLLTDRQISSSEQALVSLLSQLAHSFDGAVLGIALAYAAVRSLLKFSSTSSSPNKILKAPSVVHVSDLRSILAIDDDQDSSSSSSQPSDYHHPIWPNVLLSQESGDKAVIVQRTQTEKTLRLV